MGVVVSIRRFDVFLVALDPAVGSEIRKTRPCVVVSPDEMNSAIRTVIVAPMTSKGRDYPTRVACTFQDVRGQVVLDQLRTIDKDRLVKRLGRSIGRRKSRYYLFYTSCSLRSAPEPLHHPTIPRPFIPNSSTPPGSATRLRYLLHIADRRLKIFSISL